jgi:hypothetical protein
VKLKDELISTRFARFFLAQNMYQNGVNYTERPQNIPEATKSNKFADNLPNGHKIYQHLSSKIFPNWEFKFENIPSGNPDFKEEGTKSSESVFYGFGIQADLLFRYLPSWSKEFCCWILMAKNRSARAQGCQMVFFHTKIPILVGQGI